MQFHPDFAPRFDKAFPELGQDDHVFCLTEDVVVGVCDLRSELWGIDILEGFVDGGFHILEHGQSIWRKMKWTCGEEI
jgi:hypothetical protein